MRSSDLRVGTFKKILNHLLYFGWKQLLLPWVILFKRVDVVVAPDYMLPLIHFGAKGVPVFHDTFYWELRKNYNPLWRVYFLFLVRAGLRKSSMIISTTEYISGKIRRLVTHKYPIQSVYQCAKELKPANNSYDLAQHGIASGSPYFLHLGVFDDRKNLVLLVEAFDQFLKTVPDKDFKLVLAGSPAVTIFHNSFGKVQQLVKEKGLGDRVILPGFVPEGALSVLYNRAFAYVFPSLEEGFGIPVLEAMQAQIPVIISDQPALVEVAGGAACVFDRHDPAALCQQMVQLQDEGIRLQLISKGKARATQFGRDQFAADFHQSMKTYLSLA